MFCVNNKRLLLLIVLGFISVLGLAYVYHWQVILAYSPFLLMLMCPLMHLFMMGGHGGHDREQHSTKDKKKLSCH